MSIVTSIILWAGLALGVTGIVVRSDRLCAACAVGWAILALGGKLMNGWEAS